MTDTVRKGFVKLSQSKISAISLSKVVWAIRGIVKKYTANPITGARSMTAAIAINRGNTGFGRQQPFSYNLGEANPFLSSGGASFSNISRKSNIDPSCYPDNGVSNVLIFRLGIDRNTPIRQRWEQWS